MTGSPDSILSTIEDLPQGSRGSRTYVVSPRKFLSVVTPVIGCLSVHRYKRGLDTDNT